LFVERAAILQLAGLDTPQIANFLCELLLGTSLKTGGCLLALALADYGFQWWRLEQSLKLSAAEMREEQRNLQANPEIAARRRAMQRDRV
jgi:flagellar biosynthetic protein FlhB